MPDFIGPIRPKVAGAFKIVEAADLGGVFIKSVTAGGLVTYQDAADAEQTVQLSLANIVQWWGPAQTEALPAGETDRSALVVVTPDGNALRYRSGQAVPSKVVVGTDPGIRALTAADAADADLLPLDAGGNEVLPDFAVFSIPVGLVVRARVVGQHDASSDISLAVFIYQVMSGDDDVLRSRGVGYTNATAEPFGHLTSDNTPRTSPVASVIIDATASAQRVSFVVNGFAAPADANGYWFIEFEVLQHA